MRRTLWDSIVFDAVMSETRDDLGFAVDLIQFRMILMLL